MKFLDSDVNEGRSLEEIASSIVDGYVNGLTRDIKKPAQPVRLGMLIKTIYTSKVSRVCWMDGERAWVVQEGSNYGLFAPLSSPSWQYCEEYRPKTRAQGKLVEMTDEQIAEKWNNPDWKVGEKVSTSQRMFTYTIEAVSPHSILLRDHKNGAVYGDSAANLSRYYRREIKMKEIQW